MKEIENKHPYIVAYGYSKNQIVSFYIDAERHLIPVRFELDFYLKKLKFSLKYITLIIIIVLASG